MANTPVLVQGLADAFGATSASIVNLKRVAANAINGPVTQIQNRGSVVDLTQDLGVRMGANRVIFGTVELLQGESGPNNEMVWKPINDTFDHVRMVGRWSDGTNSLNTFGNGYGAYTQMTNNTTDYMEITFSGTGLCLLLIDNVNGPYDLRVSVDGGAESGNIFPTSTSNTPPGARGYSSNQIVIACSGLTQGVHTAKIRNQSASSGAAFFGYETLNTNASLLLSYAAGSQYNAGKRLSNATIAIADPYNSNFESGTLGTTGGHVVVYQKADGTVRKAVNPTGTTPLYLTNANHSNEAVIAWYHWREFGVGRSDDLSTLSGTPSTAAFTLDDNETALAVSSCSGQYSNNWDILAHAALNAFWSFVFVGTGLDLLVAANPGSADTFNLGIDGTTVGTISSGSGVMATGGLLKLVSGLPYGSHIITLQRTSFVGNAIAVLRFVAYGPSKPSIPSGAAELGDYYILPSYAGNYALAGATGVIMKSPTREVILYNDSGWATTLNLSASSFGHYDSGTFVNHTIFYTFVGTGVVLVLPSQSGSGTETATISIDGATNASGVSEVNVTNNGSGNYTLGSNAVIRFSGLSYGPHTITYQRTGGGLLLGLGHIDVITPIHAPKFNPIGSLQGGLTVGNQGIGDSRNFSSKQIINQPNWAQALGWTSDPTTTSTSFVPAQDMIRTIKTSGNPIEIQYVIDTYNSAANNNFFIIKVDGVQWGSQKIAFIAGATFDVTISDSIIVPVAAGFHIVQVFWQVGGGTGTLRSTYRTLKVKELD